MSEKSVELKHIADLTELWVDESRFDRIRLEIDPGTVLVFTNVNAYFEPPVSRRGIEVKPEQFTLVKDGEEALRFERMEEIRSAFITIKDTRYNYFRRKGTKGSRCVEPEDE